MTVIGGALLDASVVVAGIAAIASVVSALIVSRVRRDTATPKGEPSLGHLPGIMRRHMRSGIRRDDDWAKTERDPKRREILEKYVESNRELLDEDDVG